MLSGCDMVMMSTGKEIQMPKPDAESLATLRGMLKPGDEVYCILRHVSSSGMSRVIDLVIPYRDFEHVYPTKMEECNDGETREVTDYTGKPRKRYTGRIRLRSIGWLAAKAMGDNFDRDRSGIKVHGCGMDMGFHLVYNLGRTIWPNGTPKPHGKRNGDPDRDGGYALKKVWL